MAHPLSVADAADAAMPLSNFNGATSRIALADVARDPARAARRAA
jgi:hypothetical protein